MTTPDPMDRPVEDIPDGPLAWMSGPEHLCYADALLGGTARVPHRWADRIAAAAVHVQAAQVQLLAMGMLESHISPDQMRAVRSQWLAVLRVPPDVDGIDDAIAEWAQRQQYEARQAGPGDEQGSDA